MLNRTNDVCIDSYLFRSNLNAVCAPRDVDDADDDLLKTTSNLSLSALHIFSTDSYQCENLNFWELDSRQSDGYTHTHTLKVCVSNPVNIHFITTIARHSKETDAWIIPTKIEFLLSSD